MMRTSLRKRIAGCLALAAGLILAHPWAQAAENDPIAADQPVAADQPIDARADQLDYNRETGWIEGRGSVVILKGDLELRADHVRVNVNTEMAHAIGHVTLRRGAEELYRGERFDYSFKTGKGTVEGLTLKVPPFRLLESRDARKVGRNRFIVRNGKVTTCALPHPGTHYHLAARELEVVPDDYLKAKGVVWYFGSVPVFYFPYWRSNLKEGSGFRFRPGHSSRMGAFLLSSYRQRLTPYLKSETHLDVREKRGVAVGQDLKWERPEAWRGEVSGYYADDQKPVADDEDPATKDVEQERYRLKVSHQQVFPDTSYLFLRSEYLSDAYLREDFFESEYRESRQPENYVSYTRRGDQVTVGALTRFRLNDFYENVDRMPELSLDAMRQRLGDSAFYYESRTTASFLERVYPEGSESDDYSSFRFDTSHMVYHIDKYFGFLNLIPRSGVRGTYYSDTRESETVTREEMVFRTNLVVNASGLTNAVVTVQPESITETQSVEGGSELRGLLELGFETSFKAFRSWHTIQGPRRHIVQPYANYTFVPEPNVTPDELPQFDEVDRLTKRNEVRIGTRNKYQKKDESSIIDLADVDVFTTYYFDPEDDQESLESLGLDAEFNPADWLELDMEGAYDIPESEISDFDTRLWFRPEYYWRLGLEHRYRREENNQITANLDLFPCDAWGFGVETRYEFETSRLEEQGLYVQRNLDCLSFKLGGSVLPGYTRSDGTEREDEIRVKLEIWLTAFPEQRFGGKSGADW